MTEQKQAPEIPYGGVGLGISETYPVSEWGRPKPGHGKSATMGELIDAGFHQDARLGEIVRVAEPFALSELARREGGVILTPEAAAALLQESRHMVLRDDERRIVATWDEGRWWTPEESAAFLAILAAGTESR